MRNILVGLALLSVTVFVSLWTLGGLDHFYAWVIDEQRNFQNQMAASLRALRSGQPGAVATLLGVCFIYGFIHAAGPGHGKLLIGGYGIAVRMTMLRLSGIALLSSLAQGASAVTLVYMGIQVLDLKRTQMIDSAEDIFAPAGHAAIALLGVWLIIRGMHRYWRTRGSHSDTHSQACENCGHRHGPSVQEAENVHSLRDLIVLVSAIAIRPCTGALFLLILTWQLDVFAAGVAGTFAMALGTASVTVTIAIAAILFRATTFQHIPGRTATRIIPAIEIIMGAIICITAVRILTAIL